MNFIRCKRYDHDLKLQYREVTKTMSEHIKEMERTFKELTRRFGPYTSVDIECALKTNEDFAILQNGYSYVHFVDIVPDFAYITEPERSELLSSYFISDIYDIIMCYASCDILFEMRNGDTIIYQASVSDRPYHFTIPFLEIVHYDELSLVYACECGKCTAGFTLKTRYEPIK